MLPQFAGKTVLIVDDFEDVCRLVQELLSEMGFTTGLASDGESAIRLASESRNGFDLLVTDLDMPDMHGFEVADRVLRLFPGTSVIYMSGGITKEDWQALAAKGVGHFLPKPFGSKELLEVMHEVFGAKKDR